MDTPRFRASNRFWRDWMNVRQRLSAITVVALVTLSCSAYSQDERLTLIARIAQAQGIERAFDEQRAQLMEQFRNMGLQALRRNTAEWDGKENPKARAAFERYMDRMGQLFATRELVLAWVSAYASSSISSDDLKSILAYYESPLGQRDMAAAHSAGKEILAWLSERAQTRGPPAMREFLSELMLVSP